MTTLVVVGHHRRFIELLFYRTIYILKYNLVIFTITSKTKLPYFKLLYFYLLGTQEK